MLSTGSVHGHLLEMGVMKQVSAPEWSARA